MRSPSPRPAIVPPQLQAAFDANLDTTFSRDQAHERIETRTLTSMVWLNDYLNTWPEIGQVFRLVRTRTTNGETTTETIYGITSLTRTEADAEKLLQWVRAHWAIENRLHHTRDVTFGEDRCRVRRGHAPRVLASFRNIALHLLHNTPHKNLPAATEAITHNPQLALQLLRSEKTISE